MLRKVKCLKCGDETYHVINFRYCLKCGGELKTIETKKNERKNIR